MFYFVLSTKGPSSSSFDETIYGTNSHWFTTIFFVTSVLSQSLDLHPKYVW